MPMCQAYGCSVRPGENNHKSAFSIPNPIRDRERCAQWLHNIGTDKFDIKTYKYNASRVVCEDHFELDCFREDVRAKIMGYTPRKKMLKSDAIPTIFVHRKPPNRRNSNVSDKRRERTDRDKSHSWYRKIFLPSVCKQATMSLPEMDQYLLDVQVYFTAKEWAMFSSYERICIKNVKENYEMVNKVGLQVNPPMFMQRQQDIKLEIKEENDSEDEEMAIGCVC
nr:uncharacterized protein LOC129282885 [Lytechinus pictus]